MVHHTFVQGKDSRKTYALKIKSSFRSETTFLLKKISSYDTITKEMRNLL